MRIRDDWNTLVSWRSLTNAVDRADRTYGRLSSGYRVNSAGDDSSGLAISQRLRSQFKGLVQANRNSLDGLSMLQTADGTLGDIHALLQRGRELTIRSINGALSQSDVQAVQGELNSILTEVDRIVDTANYNGRPLFNPLGNSSAIRAAVTGLRGGWLEQAEKVIQTYYGLVGDGSPLKIVLEANGVDAAWIQGQPGVAGRLDDLSLHINVGKLGTIGGPDGGEGPVYNDRKVARAVNQAVLARTSNYLSLDEWFKSGSSDYVAGRDEQLSADVAQFGPAAIVGAMADSLGPTWPDDDLHRSAAYVAMKYLDDQLQGFGFTMPDFMQELTANSLDDALSATLGVDAATFIDDFLMNGEAFLGTLNLSDADVGGVNPGDASEVIPDGQSFTTSPMQYLQVEWPQSLATSVEDLMLQLQVGANEGDILEVRIPEMSTYTLNLIGLDLANRPQEALGLLTTAVNVLSTARGHIGTAANRLEHVMATNTTTSLNEQESVSRIIDVDYAQEMAGLAKEQILVSASGAMMAHSNTVREHVMILLNGMGATTPEGKETA